MGQLAITTPEVNLEEKQCPLSDIPARNTQPESNCEETPDKLNGGTFLQNIWSVPF
jgi:hypothetical protein